MINFYVNKVGLRNLVQKKPEILLKGPSYKSLAEENIGFNCTCDASRPAVVENLRWHRRAVYLDAVTIGLQGRH